MNIITQGKNVITHISDAPIGTTFRVKLGQDILMMTDVNGYGAVYLSGSQSGKMWIDIPSSLEIIMTPCDLAVLS